MAKVLGEAGRYTSEEALKKHHQLLLTGFLGIAFPSILLGCVLGLWLPFGKLSTIKALVIEIVLATAAVILAKIIVTKLDQIERGRRSMRKGAEGEVKVAQILSDFPDGFRVINGLSTPFGDLDHVVVGPTGVFIVDTKNWKGVVAADGHGELLLNGKTTDKATIKPIVARTMSVREKVQTLCGFEPPFFKVLLAFPSAWIEARWGTTGAAFCVTDEQLYDHIVEGKAPKKVDTEEIESLALAFLALATMEKGFGRNEEVARK